MQRLIHLSFYLCLTISLSAQFPGMGGAGSTIKGKISGQVVDTLTGLAVGYAAVSLKKEGSERIINGTLSEDNGNFSFTDIKPDKYIIEVSFLGYTTKSILEVETTPKNPDYTTQTVYLVPTSYLLGEVKITEKRALIENKVDRIVFNAEDDSSIAGGDATDVLRKVPNLSVDLDGNVSIRGSQNVKILINGKPSGMFSSNVADALKMFPADQIQKVEVITSPGAKYDAEGSGGIINIVTKKKNVEGVSGTFNVSGGNRQNNAFGNLNVGKGRFGSSFNGSVFYSTPVDGTFEFLRTDITPDGNRVLSQTGIQNTSRLGFNGSASAFYDFNAYNALNTSINYRGFGFDTDGDFMGALTLPSGVKAFQFDRAQVANNIFDGYDWNTDYTRKFEGNEDQELVFAYQLSKGNQDQEISLLETNSVQFLNRDENIFNDSNNWEHTVQVDYTQPMAKKLKLEVGAKGILRAIDSDYRYSPLNKSTGAYEIDPTRSNIFKYDQDVLSGYSQFSFPAGKFQMIAGLRYERTNIGGDFNQGEDGFSNNYDNWIPNFTVSRPLSNFRNLKLSYSKRIQRPTLLYINPFRNTTDQTNIQVGNPQLDPELTHQFELGYNTRILGFNIFGNAYFKKTFDIIEQVLGINENGVSVTTFSNVGTNNSFGVNGFINKTINKLNIRFGGDLFSYDATGIIAGKEVENSALNYQIFTGGDYAITGTLKADFFGFFRSNQPTLQGTTPSFSIFGFGLRKDIKDWSVGIRVIEPFSDNKEFNSDLKGENFTQISGFSLPFRSFGLNLRYKFGKVDFRERNSKIKNTDQKAAGDQQGGGQQGGTTTSN